MATPASPSGGGKKKAAKWGGKNKAPTEIELLEVHWKKFLKSSRFQCAQHKVPENEEKELLRIIGAPLTEDAMENGFMPPQQLIVPFTASSACCKALLTAFENNPYNKLKSLCFWNTQIKDEGVIAVATSLRHFQSLNKVELIDCMMGVKGCSVLGAELGRSGCKHIRYLRVDSNAFGSEGAKALFGGLAYNTYLNVVSAAYCGIGSDAAPAVAEFVKTKGSTLVSLNLEGNRLGNAGAAQLGAALVANTQLVALNLSLNEFGAESKAVQYLFEGVRLCPTLARVNITGNILTEESSTALFEQVRATKQLQELWVTPSMSKELFAAIKAAVDSNRPKSAKATKKKKKAKKKS